MRKLFSGFTCGSKKKEPQKHKKYPKSVSISLDLSGISPIQRISDKDINQISKTLKEKISEEKSANKKDSDSSIFIEPKLSKKVNLMKNEDSVFIERLKNTFSDLFDPRYNYERCVITNDLGNFSPEQRRIYIFLFIEQLSKFQSTKNFLLSEAWIKTLWEYIVLNQSHPGPVENEDLIKPILPKSYKGYVINEYLWWFLILCFGGGPEVNTNEGPSTRLDYLEKSVVIKPDEKITQKILKIANTSNVRRRKELEADFMRSESDAITTRLYMVDKAWIEGYQDYLIDSFSLYYQPLMNKKLKESLMNDELKREDYCLVNERVWYFLSQIYYGDVMIPIFHSTLRSHMTDFEDFWDGLKEDFPVKEVRAVLDGIALFKISGISQKIVEMGNNFVQDEVLC